MELNQQQVRVWLQLMLSASGPFAAIILAKTGVSEGDYALYVNLALAFLPGVIVGVWSWYNNRKVEQIKTVEALPEVATVVVKDTADGELAKLAQSEAHPNIVTETQNEKDAKEGTKV